MSNNTGGGSHRQTRPHRSIAGPQSALTDYLASHNISAARIAADHAQRVASARQAAQAEAATQRDGESDFSAPEEESDADSEAVKNKGRKRKWKTKAEATPRKGRSMKLALRSGDHESDSEDPAGKTKKSGKGSRKSSRKKSRKSKSDDADDSDLAEVIALAGKIRLPGQQENCAECDKRFTVTPYSRAGPDGGLLCTPCGKELGANDDAPKKRKRVRVSGGPVGRRRTMQSALLDGNYHLGAKDLVTLCVEHLAKNIHLATDLGGLPDGVMEKIACIVSKLRLLNPETLNLFLQPSADTVHVYDGAKLAINDIKRIFQSVPDMKHFEIRNAVQFKDEVMEYMLGRQALSLESFSISGANLISQMMWLKFLKCQGIGLQSLGIQFTDKHVDDVVLKAMGKHCKDLRRLKICHNQAVSGHGVEALGSLKGLERLALHLQQTVHPDQYIKVVHKIGNTLEALSLVEVPTADNSVLDALHAHCRKLTKLKITGSDEMTDEGFVRLFTGWENAPLHSINFEKCRQAESFNSKSDPNPHNIGLCSKGFQALMEHSGSKLNRLNIASCRHISEEAFEEAFAEDKEYPELRFLQLSFCSEVNDFVVGNIFRRCPNLHEVVVFGCMKLKDVRIPRGRALIGMPNAMGMRIEGNESE